MKPRTVVMSLLVSLLLLVCKTAITHSQSNVEITHSDLYVPFIVFQPSPPAVEPLVDCSVGFELSQPFPNGTTFEQIGNILGIKTEDIWNNGDNREQFPNGVIYSTTNSSPICWLGEDVYQTLYLEDADDENPLNLYFPKGRGHYLTPVSMATTNQACETLSVVFTVADGTWNGAPIVGLLRRGTELIGKLVCDISTYVPEGIWGKAAYVYPAAVAGSRIYEATTQGDLTPATLFDEEGAASLIYFAVDLDKMYVKCGMDSLLESDKLLIPHKRRLYQFGTDKSGCLFADQPFFEGQQALSFSRLNATMLLAIAYVQAQTKQLERPMTEQEVADLMNRIQQELNDLIPDPTPDPLKDKDPFWWPEKNPTSCPEVSVPLYVNDAVNETTANVEYFLKYKVFPQSELLQLILFSSDAKNIAIHLEYEPSYTVPKPRTDGALSRIVSAKDSNNRIWAVQLVCQELEDIGFVWVLQPVGRANTGLLRSDKDDVTPYAFK